MHLNNKLAVFTGRGFFAQAVIRRLLDLRVKISAVVVPTFTDPVYQTFPVVTLPQDEYMQQLRQAADDILLLNRQNSREIAAQLSERRPDYVVSIGFPRKIPPALYRMANKAALNVHASLLPKYRGPYPIFWQYRNGEPELGITVHLLTDKMDSGPIVIQKKYVVPDGISGKAIDAILGDYSAELLMQVLSFGVDHSGLVEQSEQNASYYSIPDAKDFQLDTEWSAKHAFNFMRATQQWGNPFTIQINGTHYFLKKAISHNTRRQLDEAIVANDGEYAIQFNPGVLWCNPWSMK